MLSYASLHADGTNVLQPQTRFIPPLSVLEKYTLACGDRLTATTSSIARINILKAFGSFSMETLPDRSGFKFTPNYLMATTKPKIVHPIESPYVYRIDHWSTPQTQVSLLDLGYKNLEFDMDNINLAALNQMEKSNEPFQINMSASRASERGLLRVMRWLVHSAVLKKYQQMKDYLTDNDFNMLTWSTTTSDNSDLFALVTGEPLTPATLTLQTLADRTALTIQIMYYGKKDFHNPTVEGAQEARGVRLFSNDDKLPFEDRLPLISGKVFTDRLFQRFDRAHTCEFIRYAKFDNTLPRDIHDKFLLEAMLKAKSRGMRTILASGDSLTTRLFRRYNFQVFDQLPSRQQNEPEYLSYLEVDSPEFNAVIEQLQKSSQTVKRDP